ncbi:MAG TPA: hypothetical protein VEB88_04915 [Candidatus Acidoferrales bacterium]|nr:hypothetical protein [Candidatus Acidoferrales bacterium]
MRSRDAKKIEKTVNDSYAPLNIVAVSEHNDRVILSAKDFEKLLVCRDIILLALNTKRDVPYPLVEQMMSSFD